MRLIDADALVESLTFSLEWLQRIYDDAQWEAAKAAWGGKLVDCMEMIRRVKEMPTVVPTPVVLCKGCRYAFPPPEIEGEDIVWCSKRESFELADGFCYEGEREDEST